MKGTPFSPACTLSPRFLASGKGVYRLVLNPPLSLWRASVSHLALRIEKDAASGGSVEGLREELPPAVSSILL